MDQGKHDVRKFSHSEMILPQEETLEVGRQKSNLTLGVPKETAFYENRVPLIPDGVGLLSRHGHRVLIEAGSGTGAHFTDHEYSEAGGVIVYSTEEVYKADTILKVSPVTADEMEFLRPKQTIFSTLHMGMQEQDYFRGLMAKKVTTLAFELIRDKSNVLSVIRAMSEIAGSSSVFIAAEYLRDPEYGRGQVFGGITGIRPSEVVIIGAGTVALSAARSAMGLGAMVRVFDNSVYRLRRLQNTLGVRIFTSILHPKVLLESIKAADVVICAIHSQTGKTPCIITEDMISQMKEGSVIIDISIDQGGCIETSHPTNHKNPVFQKYGVTHYCVPNIPSRVPHTASQSLDNIFVPILLDIGNEGGIENLLKMDPGLRHGVYLYNGILTNHYIGKYFNMPSQDIDLLMAAFH